MHMLLSADFWFAVGQIIVIDILLGGDNAVVIALACRRLPQAQRKLGILWGTIGAIALRVLLIAFAMALLQVPYLKLIGAALLLWIGIKLIAPDEEGGHDEIPGSDRLWAAVRTVIVADLVMSVDNVMAIAGAAEGAGSAHKMPLVIFGLLVSIPIIVWGSQFVIQLMDRFPVVVTFGGMLLGWIAGAMAVDDPGIGHWVAQVNPGEAAPLWHYGAASLGAMGVLGAGLVLRQMKLQTQDSPAEPRTP